MDGESVYVAVRVRPLNQRWVRRSPFNVRFSSFAPLHDPSHANQPPRLRCICHSFSFFSLYILPLSPFLTFLPSTSFRFVYSELDKGDGSNWVVNDDSLTQCTANGRPIPTASYSYGKNNMRRIICCIFPSASLTFFFFKYLQAFVCPLSGSVGVGLSTV